jgi:hypothetical protein
VDGRPTKLPLFEGQNVTEQVLKFGQATGIKPEGLAAVFAEVNRGLRDQGLAPLAEFKIEYNGQMLPIQFHQVRQDVESYGARVGKGERQRITVLGDVVELEVPLRGHISPAAAGLADTSLLLRPPSGREPAPRGAHVRGEARHGRGQAAGPAAATHERARGRRAPSHGAAAGQGGRAAAHAANLQGAGAGGRRAEVPRADGAGGGSGAQATGTVWVTLRDGWVTLGDANSSLGDANSSLGDAESSLGDAKSFSRYSSLQRTRQHSRGFRVCPVDTLSSSGPFVLARTQRRTKLPVFPGVWSEQAGLVARMADEGLLPLSEFTVTYNSRDLVLPLFKGQGVEAAVAQFVAQHGLPADSVPGLVRPNEPRAPPNSTDLSLIPFIQHFQFAIFESPGICFVGDGGAAARGGERRRAVRDGAHQRAR